MSDFEWQNDDGVDRAERLGAFANAFRVLEGPTEPECYLDFLVYSPAEECAVVVARVRIGRHFLPLIHGRLDEILLDSALRRIGGPKDDTHLN